MSYNQEIMQVGRHYLLTYALSMSIEYNDKIIYICIGRYLSNLIKTPY